ncbi:MAG TPA: protein phosphatase 2C domain-containing protein [Terriglobales bacterium]|jgi:serine/threonine protein phosphatase PrpC
MTALNPIMQTATGERENQDRGAVIAGSRCVLVVADGVGGMSGGAEAAAMVIDLIREHAELLANSISCTSLLQRIDQDIARDPNAGETTCALAVATDDQVFGASVGDSGVWIIGENTFTDLTQRQSRKPLVGSGSASAISFAERRVTGTCLLLATDGLLKYAPSERIVAVCRGFVSESDAVRLIELARYPSGALPDDVTVILTRL